MNPDVARAVLLMLLATLLLASMHALVRHLGQQLPPFEIAFFRNLFGLLVIVPLILRHGRTAFISRQPGLQLLRGLSSILAMLGWFYGLSLVPVAEATALSFTSAIFASLGAVVLLGERMRLRRWSAVAVGFVGALVLLRPGFTEVGAGAVVILLGSVCWGASIVIVKRLSRTDSTISIVVWMSIMLTLYSLPPALYVWQWPDATQLAWLLLVGGLASGGHLAMVGALRRVDATLLMPLDYTRLIWTSLLGYWAFSEVPDRWTWIGGSLIFASAAYITFREARLRRAGAG
ncbi:MAG: DMT family transporter [Candidatus Competibacterales bacterium]|nr:DMT family transporter [Candidatus Competibacterales bacterium]